MRELLRSIGLSLQTRNWYAALALALTVPDICVSLEADDEWTDGKRYAAWFDTNLKRAYGPNPFFREGALSGADCYALRCAVLHRGQDDISKQPAHKVFDRIVINESEHLIWIGDNLGQHQALAIAVPTFCTDMLDAAHAWLKARANDARIQERLVRMARAYEGGLRF
jgi:hypothetical protein